MNPLSTTAILLGLALAPVAARAEPIDAQAEPLHRVTPGLGDARDFGSGATVTVSPTGRATIVGGRVDVGGPGPIDGSGIEARIALAQSTLRRHRGLLAPGPCLALEETLNSARWLPLPAPYEGAVIFKRLIDRPQPQRSATNTGSISARFAHGGLVAWRSSAPVSEDCTFATELTDAAAPWHAVAQLQLEAPDRHPGRGTTLLPAAFVLATLDTVPITLDALGQLSFAAATTVLMASAQTAHILLVDATAPLATLTAVLGDGDSVTWSPPNPNSPEAVQLSVLGHGERARTKARAIDPSLAWHGETITAELNAVGVPCDATYESGLVRFGKATSSGLMCRNTGLLADFVYHELGHAFHDAARIEGIAGVNLAVGEALADQFTASLTNDPAFGRGLYYTDTPLRRSNLDHDRFRFPEDTLISSPHAKGRIVAGTLWELRNALAASQGAAGAEHADWIAHQLRRYADDFDSLHIEALLADDDDGDLINGTPNQCAIDNAFSRHGLGAALEPAEPLSPHFDPANRRISVSVRGGASLCNPDEISDGYVEWVAVNGEVAARRWQTVPLARNGQTWTATLPVDIDTPALEYRVVMRSTQGRNWRFPTVGGAEAYSASLVDRVPIVCTNFEDDSISMWSVSGDDGFAIAPPQGERTNLGPRRAHSGANVLATDPGIVPNDGIPRASITHRATLAAVDTVGFTEVRLQFRRWLDIDGDSNDRAEILADDHVIWRNGTPAISDREWIFQELSIPISTNGSSPAISFQLRREFPNPRGGWHLDDVCLMGRPTQQAAPPSPTNDVIAPANPDAPPADGCAIAVGAPWHRTGFLGIVLAALAATIRRRRPRVTSRFTYPRGHR